MRSQFTPKTKAKIIVQKVILLLDEYESTKYNSLAEDQKLWADECRLYDYKTFVADCATLYESETGKHPKAYKKLKDFIDENKYEYSNLHCLQVAIINYFKDAQ